MVSEPGSPGAPPRPPSPSLSALRKRPRSRTPCHRPHPLHPLRENVPAVPRRLEPILGARRGRNRHGLDGRHGRERERGQRRRLRGRRDERGRRTLDEELLQRTGPEVAVSRQAEGETGGMLDACGVGPET